MIDVELLSLVKSKNNPSQFEEPLTEPGKPLELVT